MVSAAQQQPHSQMMSSGSEDNKAAIFVVATLFFLFGFITCLNDILVPHLKELFSLNHTESMLVQFTFFAAYFIVSWPASKLISKHGYKTSFIIGLVLTALGCFSFIFAAKISVYYVFLCGLFVLASGITILQVAANPYLTIIGKKERASSRLIFAQGLNSLGTTIAPILGSFFILAGAVKTTQELSNMSSQEIEVYKEVQASSVQLPYFGIGLFVLLIALGLFFYKFPKNKVQNVTALDDSKFNPFDHPKLVLGTIGIFAYVGAEVSIGSFMVNFLADPKIGNMTLEQAGYYLPYYWGGAMVGRFIGSYITTKIQPSRVLFAHAFIACVLVGVTIFATGSIALWAIIAVGLFNSIMFPTIFVLSTEGLGKYVEKGSGIICMAIVGGAIVPLLQGYIADKHSLNISYFVPLVCYVYIAFFALKTKKDSLTQAA